MRFTRSQARARAVEEAQASLLQLALLPSLPLPTSIHSLSVSDVDVSDVSLPSPLVSLLVLVLTISLLVLTISLLVPAVYGLPVAGFEKKQERYRVALRVQCVTLFDAGILLDVICSRWLVTKSAVYRQKRIVKARGYNPKINP